MTWQAALAVAAVVMLALGLAVGRWWPDDLPRGGETGTTEEEEPDGT